MIFWAFQTRHLLNLSNFYIWPLLDLFNFLCMAFAWSFDLLWCGFLYLNFLPFWNGFTWSFGLFRCGIHLIFFSNVLFLISWSYQVFYMAFNCFSFLTISDVAFIWSYFELFRCGIHLIIWTFCYGLHLIFLMLLTSTMGGEVWSCSLPVNSTRSPLFNPITSLSCSTTAQNAKSFQYFRNVNFANNGFDQHPMEPMKSECEKNRF